MLAETQYWPPRTSLTGSDRGGGRMERGERQTRNRDGWIASKLDGSSESELNSELVMDRKALLAFSEILVGLKLVLTMATRLNYHSFFT